MSKFNNNQVVLLNNLYKKNHNNELFIWKNIDTCDENILKKVYNEITDSYKLKLNILNNILDNPLIFPIYSSTDIIKLFKIFSPINNEYNMSSFQWNIKKVKNNKGSKLFVQNSISKIDSCPIFYKNYIDKIKKLFILANIKFNYFEFKNKRFYKTKDLIFVFDD